MRGAVEGAKASALATAASLGLATRTAEVLQDSNRVVLRLSPDDTVVRMHPAARASELEFELAAARALVAHGAPVAPPDPRFPEVHRRDDFAMTFWQYFEPCEPRTIAPPAYGSVLTRLHEAMRETRLQAPHFTERAGRARGLLADEAETAALGRSDRALISEALEGSLEAVRTSAPPEQLLHGEPHGDNLLRTSAGLLFIDLEACCRGPVEFDLADVPTEVAAHYPAHDPEVLRACRRLVLAMVATWCWAGFDAHQNLRKAAPALTQELRGG